MPVTAVVNRTSPTMASVKRVDSFMAWPRGDRTQRGKMLPRAKTAGQAGAGIGRASGRGRGEISGGGGSFKKKKKKKKTRGNSKSRFRWVVSRIWEKLKRYIIDRSSIMELASSKERDGGVKYNSAETLRCAQ